MTTPTLTKHDTIGIINAIRNETTLKFGLRRGHTITSLVPPELAGRLLEHLYDLCRTELMIERNKERSRELRAEMVTKAQQGEAGSTHVPQP